MKVLARAGIAAAGVIGLVAAVVAVRTAAYVAPGALDAGEVDLAPAVQVDVGRAAQHLAAAVGIRTVSHQDPGANDWAEWERLRGWLRETYPSFHSVATLELVASHTLLYTWAGSDPSLPPIVPPAPGLLSTITG